MMCMVYPLYSELNHAHVIYQPVIFKKFLVLNMTAVAYMCNSNLIAISFSISTSVIIVCIVLGYTLVQ